MIVAVAALLAPLACGGPPASSTTGFDPSSVSGTVVLSGWQASPEEGAALKKTLDAFKVKYPKITVDYQPISGDYPTVMVAKFSAHQPPDVFYVDSSVAPDWIKQGLLEPLNGYASSQNFDTNQFFSGYLDAFKGADGQVYGFPKDGNTLGMAYNKDMLSKAGVQPPTNWDEIVSVGQKLKASGVATPYCLPPDLARVGAFIYQNGGGIIDAKNKKDLIDSPATKDAITFYMNLYKQGLAKTPSDMGVDWPGKALGEQKTAIVFEGGWLDSFMAGTYPNIKYGWMEMPKGKQKATLGFTVSFSIGKESPNKKGAWVLDSYLTGAEGMKLYTSGGVANPSRKDVGAPPGKEVLVQSAAFAHPWSFIAGFSKVIDAFNNAITGAEQGNGSADTVVSKTKAAIDNQLNAP
ncbi:MAG: extracellular solute-binding protein [Candidatus Dormibacteraeota bacterium]|nr:extracellular solute-binding protein [Candidatus Dormibacteraeota bacterium]